MIIFSFLVLPIVISDLFILLFLLLLLLLLLVVVVVLLLLLKLSLILVLLLLILLFCYLALLQLVALRWGRPCPCKSLFLDSSAIIFVEWREQPSSTLACISCLVLYTLLVSR
jgi:hypothetical protein